MKLNLCTLVQMHYSINTAWNLGPVPFLQQDAGNVKAQSRLRFKCTHPQQSLPRAIKYVAVLDRSLSPDREAFPVCHRQLQSCCTPLPGALLSAPALMLPNAQNLEMSPKEEGSSLHRALGLPPQPALVRVLCSCCQHWVWCPNITPSSAVATTASKPTQPAANVCKKSHLQGRKISLLLSLKALPGGRQQEPEHCRQWCFQESCFCTH